MRQDDRHARRQDGRADEEQVVRSELSDRELGDRVAQRTAQAGPAADQAEQPLGLARVVDVVGQRPELTDEKNPENLAEDVERDRDPHGLCLQQDPEHTEQDDDGRLGQRNDVLAGQATRGAAVQVHENADEDRRPQQHPRQVVRSQVVDGLRLGDGLEDVVRRHRQERIGEHQQRDGGLRPRAPGSPCAGPC